MELLGGIDIESHHFLGLVSRWMTNGDLNSFIRESIPLLHRLQIVSRDLCDCSTLILIRLLQDAWNCCWTGILQGFFIFIAGNFSADALYSVHAKDIIHGNLASSNILIDDDGRARLTGFQFSHSEDLEGTEFKVSDNIFNARRCECEFILF